jgi:hypothetical protein
MAFTDLDNTAPPKTDVPASGIVIGSRACGRGDKKTRYIAMLIGPMCAKAINFHLDQQQIAVRVGTGSDAGKLAVVVDAKGKFQAKRQKAGHYLVTITAGAAAHGNFKVEFDRFVIEKARVVPATGGQPPMVVIPLPDAMQVAA